MPADARDATSGAPPPLAGPGAEFLRAYPQLAAYARAFIESGAPSAAFFWQAPAAGWLQVIFTATENEHGDAGTQASLTRTELPHRLTNRELDVLTLMTGGLSNGQIASRLVSSPRTISTHVEHILAKLGQTSRTGAAAMAVERGFLKLPVPGDGQPPEGLTIGFLHAQVSGEPTGADAAGLREPRLGDEAAARAPVTAFLPARPTTAFLPARPTTEPADDPHLSPRRARGPNRRLPARPLLVGSAFPLRGPVADDGRQMLNGSALAIAEINERGGIGGRKVEQVLVDMDVFSPDGVRRALEQLFAAGVDALTSGYLFAEDLARDLAADFGAPYVHAMTSQSQAATVRDNRSRYRNFFQVCPTEVHYGPRFVRFLDHAQSCGWQPASRRVAFIESVLPSSRILNPLTVERAERSRWEIASVQTAPATDIAWDAVVSELVRVQPAAVVITQILAAELARFQRRAVTRLPETLIYAIYNPSVPEFLDMAGEAAEGLVWATVTGTYHDTIGQRFRADYAAAFGSQPGWSHAGISYDEIHLLAQAWMSVPNPHDSSQVCDQLRRIRYRGVNGAYYLDNAEQSGLSYPDTTPDPSLGQAHLILQVQDGAHKIISPAPYAQSTFRAPGAVVLS